MKHDQRSALAEKLWRDKQVASCSMGIAASFLHTVSWPISRSARSIQALTIRLNELATFLKIQKSRSVKKVRYGHLIDFTADDNAPSVDVTKSRVCTLRQFYHFLTLHRIIPENIATGLPYPKIEKTVPEFLTQEEYKLLIRQLSERVDSSMGLRNLIIIMLYKTTKQGFV